MDEFIEILKAHVTAQPIAGRTWEQCAAYCIWRAEQKLDRRGGNNCVPSSDAEVFGWATHYLTEPALEQEWIERTAPKAKPVAQPAVKVVASVPAKPKAKPKKEQKNDLQLTMF